MAYLNPDVIVVDAVLTRKGRELLARGDFQITQFALSDDEIDYTLYNPNHPSGSAFYGEALRYTPVLEAAIDETQLLRSKLITLPRGTARIPVLNLGYESIVLAQGASLQLTPETLNHNGTNAAYETSGYSVTLGDVRLVASFKGVGLQVTAPSEEVALSTGTKLSRTELGTSFTIRATEASTLFTEGVTSLTTTLLVVGRDSGARMSIPFTIQKKV